MDKAFKKSNKKNSLTCKECCRQMGDYIDGKLSVEEDVAFVSHIRECEDCREEFHNYYNFMTNLYFLNYGYNDKFPTTEETLMRATEENELRYRKNQRSLVVAAISLFVMVLFLVMIIVLRDMGVFF